MTTPLVNKAGQIKNYNMPEKKISGFMRPKELQWLHDINYGEIMDVLKEANFNYSIPVNAIWCIEVEK